MLTTKRIKIFWCFLAVIGWVSHQIFPCQIFDSEKKQGRIFLTKRKITPYCMALSTIFFCEITYLNKSKRSLIHIVRSCYSLFCLLLGSKLHQEEPEYIVLNVIRVTIHAYYRSKTKTKSKRKTKNWQNIKN